MKRYIYPAYLLLLLITSLSACKKNDPDYFGKTPTERSTAALSKYQTQLTSAPNGWKAILYPNGGGIYLFSIKFGADNRTTMLSDIDAETSTTAVQSAYSIKQLLAPSLVFDTYSYIHLLSDPTPALPGGNQGSGYSSDFEFSFDKMSGDTITLIGNKNGSKLTLVKAATAAEYTSFTTGTSIVFDKLSVLRTYFKRITIGGIDCELNIDKVNKILSLSYLDGNTNFKTVSSNFYIDGTTNNIVLSTPLLVGKTSITTIEKITGDAVNHTVNLTVNSNAIQIKEAIAPLKYDLTAAATFFNKPSNGAYWSSNTGFTVDNVSDAYKVSTIPNFGFLLFYPAYRPTYSRLGFISNNAYGAYGPAPVASFPANGKIVFNNFGSFGTAPAAIAPIVKATSDKFFDPNGYYVIATGPKTYDLVNATDARAWISFY
ncbi:protein of unknown function [Mucilaginibacter lappiensis]|uniref:DUF4302 domain-containing protein n=1 Tax=Mucilaginibacter lappiensis TaxID=354630 RepID=A0ABR6PJ10_9SPHI|nr:DUF4302 domain-containing protein [Mucilaginibacter lappiensis]MBB6109199.1 hypothetical protein [Mucilaginibacter lappiensis]SIQ79730.1 protein of unknown function [Mucilaginibacter lappiensis]